LLQQRKSSGSFPSYKRMGYGC